MVNDTCPICTRANPLDTWQLESKSQCVYVSFLFPSYRALFALTYQMATRILEQYQRRVPPSRRMADYRVQPVRSLSEGSSHETRPDRTIMFEQAAIGDSRADRAYLTSTFFEVAVNCQNLLEQLNYNALSSRLLAQSDRSLGPAVSQQRPFTNHMTMLDPVRSLLTVYDAKELYPSDEAVAKKLAACGTQMNSKKDLAASYGWRQTRKVLSGKTAIEDGKLYDMSLIRACYNANQNQFWLGSALLLTGCSLCATNMQSPSLTMLVAVRMGIPLVTKAIIDDILAVQARLAGVDDAQPRPLPSIFAVLVAFLAMMIACNVLTVHSARVNGILGSKTRAAVGWQLWWSSKPNLSLLT